MIKQLFFPPRCVSCGALLVVSEKKETPYFCAACAEGWQREQLAQCPLCYAEFYRCRCMPRALARAGVSAYLKMAPYGRGERSAVTRGLVYAMKREPRERVFAALAADMAPTLSLALSERPSEGIAETLLVPLPRTRRAKLRYGFDQATLLARALSPLCGIECRPVLRRVRDGKEQKTRRLAERAANVRGAFLLEADLTGQRIVLIDDLLTSGATAAEAARLCMAHGAVDVMVFTAAFTEKEKKASRRSLHSARKSG